MKSSKGFTLVELMVVIVIIGILAAIAIPVYKNYTNKAKLSEAVTIVHNYSTSAKAWFANNGNYTGWTGSDVVASYAAPNAPRYFAAPPAATNTATTWRVILTPLAPLAASIVTVDYNGATGLYTYTIAGGLGITLP